MMAVDVSGSMRALDLSRATNRELTRLDAVKDVFEQFVLGGDGPRRPPRRRDRPGRVRALRRHPQPADARPRQPGHRRAPARLRQREDEDGTAIGAGLELAVTRLAEFKPKEKVSRIAILLTDGESNVHDIDEDTAIDDAVKAGIKVYTIGAGTSGIAPIRVDPRRRLERADADAGLDRRVDAAQDRRQDRRPVLPRDRPREPREDLRADRHARATSRSRRTSSPSITSTSRCSSITAMLLVVARVRAARQRAAEAAVSLDWTSASPTSATSTCVARGRDRRRARCCSSCASRDALAAFLSPVMQRRLTAQASTTRRRLRLVLLLLAMGFAIARADAPAGARRDRDGDRGGDDRGRDVRARHLALDARRGHRARTGSRARRQRSASSSPGSMATASGWSRSPAARRRCAR